jgi:hypothetical protein
MSRPVNRALDTMAALQSALRCSCIGTYTALLDQAAPYPDADITIYRRLIK